MSFVRRFVMHSIVRLSVSNPPVHMNQHINKVLLPNYAINPTPEQALRSNRAVLPARVIAALGFCSSREALALGVVAL